MIFDIGRARSETPACEELIHFNNAGASLMPAPVLAETIAYLRREAQIGGYETAAEAATRLSAGYDVAAELLNADASEIAFVENATRAWDMAFHAIGFQKGDRILTSVAEYASNFIAFLHVQKKLGIKIDVVPNDEYGQLSVQALSEMIDKRVKLIAVTHVPTNGGLVNPAAEIGAIAKQHEILYLLDACQSVGQMPIDVTEIGCDLLSTTGRKFLRAPRGTGLLYVSRRVIDQLDPPFLDLHSATWTSRTSYEMAPGARRFETWETNYASRIGMIMAMEYALEWGLDSIWERVSFLAETLRAEAAEIAGVTVCDLGRVRSAIVTLSAKGHEAQALKQALAAEGIQVEVSTASGALLDMQARNLGPLLRVSPHYYNTEEEIHQFCRVFERLIRA